MLQLQPRETLKQVEEHGGAGTGERADRYCGRNACAFTPLGHILLAWRNEATAVIRSHELTQTCGHCRQVLVALLSGALIRMRAEQ